MGVRIENPFEYVARPTNMVEQRIGPVSVVSVPREDAGRGDCGVSSRRPDDLVPNRGCAHQTTFATLHRLFAAVLGWLALASVGYAQTVSPHNQKPDIKADLIVGGIDAKDPQLAWVGVCRTRTELDDLLEISGRRRSPPEFDWS